MKFPHQIKAVTFDVGGTLIQPWPSVGHAYAEIAARHGKKISSVALNQRFAKAWRARVNFQYGRHEWAALVDETFHGLLEALPSESFFDELYESFAKPAAWQIFADVRPALDDLAARGFDLAIVSNWDERLRPLLDELGLTKYFQAIIVSCEVGFVKPSPVIFEQAMRKLGVPAESILHVGDSEECDVAGARAAGCQSVWLRRETDISAGQISSLRELDKI